MKHLLYTVCLIIFIGSCKKQEEPVNTADALKMELQGALSTDDYRWLDLQKAIFYPIGNTGGYLKIPFGGKRSQEFLLVKIGEDGGYKEGRIISLTGSQVRKDNRSTWDGAIKISTLNRKLLLSSSITNGYIRALHPDRGGKEEDIVPVYPSNMLPEVVVTAYVNNSLNSLYTWLLLESMFWDSSGGNYGGYYGSMDGSTGGSYNTGGSGYTSGGGWQPAPVVQVDYETQVDREGIDLQRYIDCFNKIPDDGASCSISIYADVPVDTDPDMLFDFGTGSPGHTFIQVRKSNGGQSACQNIGFYPRAGWKVMLTDAPVESKLVDNSQHEYNASFSMNLLPSQLHSVLTEMLYLKNRSYDIDNYNCTDWALSIFNKVRSEVLTIPLYPLPGSPGIGTSTPHGLFNQLKSMKAAGHPEAANIDVGFYKSWVGNSTGACN